MGLYASFLIKNDSLSHYWKINMEGRIHCLHFLHTESLWLNIWHPWWQMRKVPHWGLTNSPFHSLKSLGDPDFRKLPLIKLKLWLTKCNFSNFCGIWSGTDDPFSELQTQLEDPGGMSFSGDFYSCIYVEKRNQNLHWDHVGTKRMFVRLEGSQLRSVLDYLLRREAVLVKISS